ncbi:SDR family oxidoreductase [Nibribacter koreensis]|uniref:SDR family oxidoreductase n=1 Tax=Nibribacter koreensis TaxID=1084519 RepID=A0ABP8F825_9BACT
MAKKKISVIGCGWLGLPLAKALVQEGYSVKGSTTTPDKLELLQQAGIEPFLVSFPENSPKTILEDLLDAEIIIINLPPRRTAPEAGDYEKTIRLLIDSLPNPTSNLLFVSSTSVYAELNREVIEQDALPSPTSDAQLLRCEYWVQKAKSQQATIVRFGGLMGGSRHPGKFLAGRQNLPQPNGPVNMIHLQDCIGLLKAIIHQEKWGFTFNACAPTHPTREEFYTLATQQLDLAPPQFLEEDLSQYKVINSDLLGRELGYFFVFPNLLECLRSSEF